MKKLNIVIPVLTVFLLYSNIPLFPKSQNILEQDDPVIVYDIRTLPVFDGAGDDACWEHIPWQNIDQVWIPYGGSVSPDDYSGRYKIAWSSVENVLCLLVEIIDDVLVDGYETGSEYYQYDVTEIFIDEDKSGGLHVFDGTGQTGLEWGTNAENAFAYHMNTNFPADGDTTSHLLVMDHDGTGWHNTFYPEYSGHFPSFVLRRQGNKTTREFSLIVYNDTYEMGNEETSRVILSGGKEIGFSMAYCDNDDPNEFPKARDNFFGSVIVPEEAYNEHWRDAGYFGTIKLIDDEPTSVKNRYTKKNISYELYPNPAYSSTKLRIRNHYHGSTMICLYNCLGQEVYRTTVLKASESLNYHLKVNDFSPGMYFLQIHSGQHLFRQKLIIL